MTVVAVVQARMASTRLPGKVALPLGDKRVLDHVLEPAFAAETVDEVVVATSYKERDDLVATLATAAEADVARGSEDDVLARVCHAAARYDPQTVVRLTGDNPLVPPALIDAVVDHRRSQSCVYASNAVDRVLPLGLKAEAVDFDTLCTLERETKDPGQRQHVTSGLLDAPEQHPLSNVPVEDLIGDHSIEEFTDVRLTVDRASDYERIQDLVEELEGQALTVSNVLERL